MATWALMMASQEKGGGNVNFVRFMLNAQEDFNDMISEIADADGTEHLIEMEGAAYGYLDCISTIVSTMAWPGPKTTDAFLLAPDYVDPAYIDDVLSDWYSILEETSTNSLDRLLHNQTTEKSNADIKQEKQLPVDRGKLLIGLEVCRQKEKCSKCSYYDDRFCGATLSNDSLSYICYLEEQLKEARKHDCG